MIITNIDFNGKTYPCRVVTSIEGEQLIIGSCELLDALQTGSCNDENDGFANKEAENIYDDIFFFTDATTLALPDKELIEELKVDNAEWFA